MASDREEIQRRLRHLHEQLRALSGEPLMRGSIVERLRRCVRPSRCTVRTLPPCRTHALHLRPEDEARVRQAIMAYGRVWEIINGLTAGELRELRRAGRRPGR